MAARSSCDTSGCSIGVSTFSLLQPGLLKRDELVDILKSRCVAEETMSSLTKEMLVELYQRVVLPLPQREYSRESSGVNWRRKLDSKNRRKNISVLEEEEESSEQKGNYTIGFNGAVSKTPMKNGRTTLLSREIKSDRLKPPPSNVPSGSAPNKRIRLSLASSSSSSCTTTTKNDSSPVSEKTPPTDAMKKVTLKRSFNQVKSPSAAATGTASVKTMASPSERGVKEKKQRTKITWP